MTALLAAVPIPPLDPFGLPAPVWVLQFLTILTMFLHMLFMSFTLGGTILACVLDVLTLVRRGNHNHTVRLIWQVLPVVISFTITTGVAPLLFAQVMWGQFFYTSTVFMGLTWFAVVPLLIIAFYVTYFLVYRLANLVTHQLGRWDRAPGKRLLLTLVCVVLFGAVGWILTNNHMLSLQPDQWAQHGRWEQNRTHVTPMVTDPRFGHNLFGAIAVAGLWLTAIGWWRRRRELDPPELTAQIIKTGLWAVLPVLVLAALFGVVFLFMMPREIWTQMFTPNVYTILWWVGLLAIGGQLFHVMMAIQKPTEFRWFPGLYVSAAVTLVGMMAAREAVRFAYLGRDGMFSQQTWQDNVHVQISSLLLFAATLVITLAIVAWLIWISVAAGQRKAEPT